MLIWDFSVNSKPTSCSVQEGLLALPGALPPLPLSVLWFRFSHVPLNAFVFCLSSVVGCYWTICIYYLISCALGGKQALLSFLVLTFYAFFSPFLFSPVIFEPSASALCLSWEFRSKLISFEPKVPTYRAGTCLSYYRVFRLTTKA